MKIHITRRNWHRSRNAVLFFLVFSAFTSCRKSDISDTKEEVISPTTGTRFEFTLDSIYLYARQIYLWNDVLPSYQDFAPRQKYSFINPEINAFKNELFDLSQLKLNSATGKSYEFSGYQNRAKYSYLEFGTSKNSTVQAGTLSGEAILSKKIIQSSAKTIAYLALGSFPSLNNVKLKLNEAFEELAKAHPKYLILDLRSNGGGYVETAEYVANLIVPVKLNGKVMYTEQFNATLQTGNAKILKHQPYLDATGKPVTYKGRAATLADVDYSEKENTYFFEKKGNLESVEEIYVIVSEQTASASELLISCLKPYFNIKLVGERTYGKPVGFFGVNIDQYTIYLSSFLIKNAHGWSDYFTGMEPNIPVDVTSDAILGNGEEPCLKAAISAINGTLKLSSKARLSNISKSKSFQQLSTIVGENTIGMIEDRLKLKN